MKLFYVQSIVKSLLTLRRIIFVLFAMVFVFMPDLLWHKLTLIIHIIYESFSWVSESLLMHILGISKSTAQIIMFYGFWFMSLLLLYVFLYKLPELIDTLTMNFKKRVLQIQQETQEVWQQLSIFQKIKLLVFQFASLSGGFVFLLA